MSRREGDFPLTPMIAYAVMIESAAVYDGGGHLVTISPDPAGLYSVGAQKTAGLTVAPAIAAPPGRMAITSRRA